MITSEYCQSYTEILIVSLLESQMMTQQSLCGENDTTMKLWKSRKLVSCQARRFTPAKRFTPGNFRSGKHVNILLSQYIIQFTGGRN